MLNYRQKLKKVVHGVHVGTNMEFIEFIQSKNLILHIITVQRGHGEQLAATNKNSQTFFWDPKAYITAVAIAGLNSKLKNIVEVTSLI